MQLTIKVTPLEGEPYQVLTNLFTIIALERKFKIRASDLATGVAMEHLAFMAFECCKQQGISVSPVFDDYIKSVIAIEVVSSEDVNPTEGAHSAEASAPSL